MKSENKVCPSPHRRSRFLKSGAKSVRSHLEPYAIKRIERKSVQMVPGRIEWPPHDYRSLTLPLNDVVLGSSYIGIKEQESDTAKIA